MIFLLNIVTFPLDIFLSLSLLVLSPPLTSLLSPSPQLSCHVSTMSVTFLSATFLSPRPSAIFLSCFPLVTLSLSPQPFCHLLLTHLLSHSQPSSCHGSLSHLPVTFPLSHLPVIFPSATFLSSSPSPSPAMFFLSTSH